MILLPLLRAEEAGWLLNIKRNAQNMNYYVLLANQDER